MNEFIILLYFYPYFSGKDRQTPFKGCTSIHTLTWQKIIKKKKNEKWSDLEERRRSEAPSPTSFLCISLHLQQLSHPNPLTTTTAPLPFLPHTFSVFNAHF